MVAMAVLAPIAAPGHNGAREQAPRYEFGAELRARAETRNGGGYDPTKQDAFTTTRLRFDATMPPKRHVRTFVEAQDSHVQGFADGRNGRAFQDPVDIRESCLALGRADGPLTHFVGRREPSLINQRIIGIRSGSNTAPGWDGSERVLRRGRDSVNLLGSHPSGHQRRLGSALAHALGVWSGGSDRFQLGRPPNRAVLFHVATPSIAGLQSRRGFARRRLAILRAARRDLGLPGHPGGPRRPDTEPKAGCLDGNLGARHDARAASLAAYARRGAELRQRRLRPVGRTDRHVRHAVSGASQDLWRTGYRFAAKLESP